MAITRPDTHSVPNPPAPLEPIPACGDVVVRVRYCECDPMGVAHHASYIPWLELGRTELLRASGVSYADLEHAGVFLVVIKLAIRYRRPARYDDEIAIATRVAGGGRARIDHEYMVRRGASAHALSTDAPEELLATATSTLACVDNTGKPRALPDWLTAKAHTDS